MLRDPSIVKRGSTYYVAYTVQSWTTNSTFFNVASSTDLKTWKNIAKVNSGVANTRFTWAPEFYVEGSTVRVIASVSQTTCSSDCFKPYVYTAQNAGLTSWSGPTVMGGNYEGPSLVRMDNGSWRMYVDKYTNGGIYTSTSSDLMNWSGLTHITCSGCRHGTAIPR